MRLKLLPTPDRPREKLAKYGPGKLRDAELLAMLLGVGIRGANVIELSRQVLRKWEGKDIGAATVAELSEIRGLGHAKACQVVACFELGRRFLAGKQRAVILTPEDVWKQMADIRESKREHFVVFFLDSRNQEIKREIVSIGTLNESLVHPREVFEQAIKHSAAAVILAHNHPSNDPAPSQADIDITKRLTNAGKLMDIDVIDHVIVTKTAWGSVLPRLL